MDVLKRLLIVVLAAAALNTRAYVDEPEVNPHAIAVAEQAKKLCFSTQEYILILKFLRSTKELGYTENTSRLIAEKVARGCDGAAERFSKVLLLLKSVGVSDRGALGLALEFSSQPPDVQKNFSEIFTRVFMAEFFDYDYATAFRIALELSRDYKGEPAQVREDFIALSQYCKDKKALDLPTKLCADYTIRVAKLSQYFPEGIRKPFFATFNSFREKPEFKLDMKTSLDLTYNVLKSGPRAPENFFSAFWYATQKDGLDLDHRTAIAFALRMADRSFIGGEGPPPIPAVTPVTGAARAANP